MMRDNDADGLVCAFLLDGEGGGEQLSWPSITTWTPTDGILWVHLDYQGEEAQRWLANGSGIEPMMREALLAHDPRPRSVITDGGGMMLIIRGVNLTEGAAPEDMVSLRMWLDQHRVVTMRHRRVGAMKTLRKQIMSGSGPGSVGAFLAEATSQILVRIAEVADALEDRVAALEDAVVSSLDVALRHELADLRRQAIALRRYIGPERDVLRGLGGSSVTWLDDHARAQLAENADRLTRVLEELDAARDRAAVTHEEVASRLSEVMNQRLYTLSMVAAIFLPLGFVTGLLGVNVGGIPGTTSPWGFAIVCIGIAAVGSLQLLLFRWLRWM